MVKDVVDEVAIGSEAGVVDIVDVAAGHSVTSLIGAHLVVSLFVIAAVGQ